MIVKRTSVRHRSIALLTLGVALAVMIPWTSPRLQGGVPPAQTQAKGVSVGADNIGGVVTSSKGPEAGVWVIAETTDLPTKFRKIVVTDDAGRYLLPELPKATYKVWVRGYGLVDSKPVQATPGKTLALTAVIAPDPRAAAQYYPGRLLVFAAEYSAQERVPAEGSGHSIAGRIRLLREEGLQRLPSDGQQGDARDRAGPRQLSIRPSLAWERRLMSGQVGPQMIRRAQQIRARPRSGDVRGLEQPNCGGRSAAGAAAAAGHRAQRGRHFVGNRYRQIVHS